MSVNRALLSVYRALLINIQVFFECIQGCIECK